MISSMYLIFQDPQLTMIYQSQSISLSELSYIKLSLSSAAALSTPLAPSHIESEMLNILSANFFLFYQPFKLPVTRLSSTSWMFVLYFSKLYLQTFEAYENWKRIVKDKIHAFENDAWLQFCDTYPDTHIAQTCFENISPPDFWTVADEYSDLVPRLHTQARLMGSFGLYGSVPWLKDTDCALCFICEKDIENTCHFFLDCPQFKGNFDSVWLSLQLKITRSNPTDGSQRSNFIKNLNRQNKVQYCY